MAALLPMKFMIPQAELDAIKKQLDQWQGQPLAIRTQKALEGGAALFVPALKIAAPVSAKGQTGKYPHPRGNLRRSIRSQPLTLKTGEIAAVYAGPRVFYGQWVQHGHKIVHGGHARGDVTTGVVSGFATPNPFVDRVQGQLRARVLGFITEQIVRLA